MAVLLVALLSGVVSSLQRNDEGGSARISQTCVTMAIRTISKRLGFGVGSSDPGVLRLRGSSEGDQAWWWTVDGSCAGCGPPSVKWRPTGMPTAGVQFGVGTQFLELSFAHTIILSAIRLFVCDWGWSLVS